MRNHVLFSCHPACAWWQGRGLSVSFVLRLDPTEQCDDFVVGFFVKTLSLEAPNVMEAIGASGGDYGLGSKKSSAAATRSSSPITKRGPLTAAGGMTKTEGLPVVLCSKIGFAVHSFVMSAQSGVSLLAPPDAEVMVKLSTLFAMSQLKFFSLRALPVCLHRPGFPAAIGRARLLPVLLNAALEPLRVPTLLTFQSLGPYPVGASYRLPQLDTPFFSLFVNRRGAPNYAVAVPAGSVTVYRWD